MRFYVLLSGSYHPFFCLMRMTSNNSFLVFMLGPMVSCVCFISAAHLRREFYFWPTVRLFIVLLFGLFLTCVLWTSFGLLITMLLDVFLDNTTYESPSLNMCQLFIPHFKVLTRKAMFSLQDRVANSDNAIVCSVRESIQNSIYRQRWRTILETHAE